eukprot:1478706-Pyramimonas_sp.AAC.1
MTFGARFLGSRGGQTQARKTPLPPRDQRSGGPIGPAPKNIPAKGHSYVGSDKDPCPTRPARPASRAAASRCCPTLFAPRRR